MGRFSIWELLIVLVIVILLFGTKKLRNIGGDLGGALKSFKKAVREDEDEEPKEKNESSSQIIDSESEASNNDSKGS